MKRLQPVIFFMLCLGSITTGQTPDWGILVAIDRAEHIVMARMQVENLDEGLGTLLVMKTLKGKPMFDSVKVQFSDRHPNYQMTRQAEPPKYWYSNGQEGIWVLVNKNNLKRYELRQGNLFYEKRWEAWIMEHLIALQKRKWSREVNGISGSVIVDDVGANSLYRFFCFCLRNDSRASLYINTHYRIHDAPHNRFEAFIITPGKETIDMINGNDPGCRLAGEPGWPVPDHRDYVELKPGSKMYLLASGDLRCFFREPERGRYTFHASWHNEYTMGAPEGKVWVGRINFPVVTVYY